jgi:phosphoserine phosphatase
MKKLALFDVNGTIYKGNSFFHIVKYFVEKGLIDRTVYDKMIVLGDIYKRGELSYQDCAQQMIDVRAKDITGKKVTPFYLGATEFVTKFSDNFFPYFESLISEIRNEYDVYLVTTDTQYVAEAIKDKFRLTGYLATLFEETEGQFTGSVLQSLARGKSLVSELLKQYSKEGSFAVGDSINDADMFELVERAYCINPSADLMTIAQQRGWHIVSDLDIQATITNHIASKS